MANRAHKNVFFRDIRSFNSLSNTNLTLTSVTRFGEILPLWQKFKSLWQILMIYFLFGKTLNLLWQLVTLVG